MKTYFLILLAVIFTSSCSKYSIETDAPECLKSIAKENTKGLSDRSKAHIDEFKFQEELVYVFDHGLEPNPDEGAAVYDSNCETIGYLGGFSGNTEINGEDFSNAVYTRTVWQYKDE